MEMLGRSVKSMARPLVGASAGFHVPKRSWAQVGHVISTPPRVRVSFGEKLLHGAFMFTVWFTPVAYFMSQIKVWRRNYVED